MSLRHVVAGIHSVKDSASHLSRLITDSALYFDGLSETRSSADSYDLEKSRDLWKTSTRLTGVGVFEYPAVLS